jgi:hypothetical protein
MNWACEKSFLLGGLAVQVCHPPFRLTSKVSKKKTAGTQWAAAVCWVPFGNP